MTGVEYGLKDSSFKKTVCMCYGGGGDGVNNKHNRPEYSNTAVDIYNKQNNEISCLYINGTWYNTLYRFFKVFRLCVAKHTYDL